jgi:hypothetical protein
MTEVSGRMEAVSDANSSTFSVSEIVLIVRVVSRIARTLSAGMMT